ncbi:MAG: undecaprenyl-diphosphate phosphatase [Caldilineaceae bacterium SB0661_bin_32]|uniref:Undecaprenyl-diphosphatase n=1 Tax=Caldilineaceae bacterium SB0661_bin_32 TaxID=2605255 RepID=A0A6B1DBA3_9CHLR|nr:undecaprenyl-diphosphate phosphatase [Caldilineaceae bacterium SB0661_bin_32]
MSDLFKAFVLGLVQGASEFLPVSSSGHLVIVPWLFGWPTSTLLFDTVVHLGTLLSILAVFGRDFVAIIRATLRSLPVLFKTRGLTSSLTDNNARMGWFIVLGSVPAAITGLLFKDSLERLYHTPQAAAFFLAVTALLLAGSEWMSRNVGARAPLAAMSLRQSFLIGLAQAAALAPGISRSGTTIAAALAQGLRREAATRYSFLLGAPAFLGAGLLQVVDTLAVEPSAVLAELPALLVGFITSAVCGYAAIRLLLAYVRRNSLYLFSGYCLLVSLAVLTLFALRLR